MLHVVLYEPEIPPNTGNIIRLCANAGARLHLVEPLGFRMDDRLLRRAGLDYREWAQVELHDGLEACLEALRPPRVLAATTRAKRRYDALHYADGDALLFGPESRGLPEAVLSRWPSEQRLRVPMVSGSRSLNLSNAVAVVLYEAWRQHGFAGGG